MTRTLIYAMQSSGASAYAFQMGYSAAEREVTLCLPDVWHHHLAFCTDGLKVDHVIQKVVVTNRYTLDQHITAFRPHTVIMFRRDEGANRISLAPKPYANESGDIEFKFSLFQSELDRRRFPVVDYELMPWRFITQSQMDTMRLTNQAIWPNSELEFGKSWGFGGIRTS